MTAAGWHFKGFTLTSQLFFVPIDTFVSLYAYVCLSRDWKQISESAEATLTLMKRPRIRVIWSLIRATDALQHQGRLQCVTAGTSRPAGACTAPWRVYVSKALCRAPKRPSILPNVTRSQQAVGKTLAWAAARGSKHCAPAANWSSTFAPPLSQIEISVSTVQPVVWVQHGGCFD
jgi:hypothetical protein